MTDFLREGKALVQPSDPDAPYSDPVTAAPAAAGRELDAEIAQKVMGWTAYENEAFAPDSHWFVASAIDPVDKRRKQIPGYSTEIAAAWLVVEHLQKTEGLSFALGLNACAGGHQNGAKFFKGYQGLGHDIFDNAEHEGWYAVDETVPLAICKAAISAVRHVGTLPLAADEGR